MADLSPPAPAPAIVVDGLSIAYPRGDGSVLQVVQDVSFAVPPGAFVALLGPSGCGKSTILRAISGLVAPSAGRILVDGDDVRDPPPRVGFMFQRDTLLPWATVAGNIAVGAELGGLPRRERPQRVAELIALLRLDGFAEAFPAALSGGMRQRVALGRLLAYQPLHMLMDEPFGALDSQTKIVMGRELLRLWETHRRTVLFVTHDIEEAVSLADRVIVLSARPGRIVGDYEVGLPRPRGLRTLRSDPRFAALTEAVWSDLQLPA